MGLEIKSRSYKDHFDRVIGFPIANQGDKGTYIENYSLWFGTFCTNAQPIQFLGSGNSKLILSAGTWSDFGITDNDMVTIYLTDSATGTTVTLSGVQVLIVNNSEMTINYASSLQMTFLSGWVYTNKVPEALDVVFNLTPSDQSGLTSIIDGSTTKLRASNLLSVSAGGFTNMTQLGNRSGSIIISSKLSRSADTVDPTTGAIILNYSVEVVYRWHGLLSVLDQPYFFDALTVTPIFSTTFYPLFNNMAINLNITYKEQNDGNSGFRDENFNQGLDDFSVQSFVWRQLSGSVIPSYDYSQPVLFEAELFTQTTFGSKFGLIFFNDIQDLALVSANASNNNGNYNHARHIVLAEFDEITGTSPISFLSTLGVNGEQLSFDNVGLTVVGNVATIKGQITPNAQFISKFSDQNNLEKDFVFLVRSETASFSANNYSTTVNSLLWKGSGEIAPVVLGNFPMKAQTMRDHYKSETNFVIIEDDNRLETFALFERNASPYLSVTMRNMVKNVVTGEFFYLESYTMPLNQTILQNQPISANNGTQPINESQTVYFNLPATANNRTFELSRAPLQDEPNFYGVFIKFPFLQRWESWIPQNGVNVSFYGSANKDWMHYQNGDWKLFVRLELNKAVGSYINDFEYDLTDYDANPNVTHTFTFERLDGTPITTPLLGETTRIISTWTSSQAIIPDWLTLTAEPYKGLNRQLISSLYPQGVQPNNPLVPIQGAGDVLSITGVNTNTVVATCLFDPNRINTSKGISLTSRIADIYDANFSSERTKKDFDLVQLPYVPKNKGDNYICCDCEPRLVLASITDSDIFKNDWEDVYHILDLVTDTCVFKIHRNGVLLTNYGIANNFPNDPKLVGFAFNWRDYLINYGGGCYEITKEYTVAGLTFTEEWGHFNLREYSSETADGTVRIIVQYGKDSQFMKNTQMKRANFSGSDYETCYRFNGFFGLWQPNPTTINHYSSNGMLRNAKTRYKGSYELTLNANTECAVDYLTKELLLMGSIFKVSDYNFTNVSQKEVVTWTVLDEEAGIEVLYYDDSRKATVNVGLRDMFNNEVSRFDGSVDPMGGISYQLPFIGSSGGGACPSAMYNLINSLGITLSSGLIASGGTVNITAPDGTAVVQYADGTPILTEPIPSGVSKTVPVPNPSGWYRPSEWIDVPTPQPNEAYFLFAVFENAPNQIAFSPIIIGGTATVEFLQSATSTPFATYTTGLNNLSVNWSDCLPSTFFADRNYRQCIIRVKCVGGNLTGWNMAISHATYGSGKLLNILEATINTTNISNIHNFGNTSQLPYKLECINYVGPSVSISLAGTFMYCTNLKEVNIDNTITANGSIRDMFHNCGIEYMPSNLSFTGISNIYEICRSSKMKIVGLDLLAVTSSLANTFLLSEVEEITLINCQNITVSIGSLALPSLHRLILQGYRLSFTIANSLLFKEQAQLDLINSLADLTGVTGQFITMTNLTQYPSVIALAGAKNWVILA